MQRGTRALTGVGLVVLGALLGMLALTVLPWYRSSFGGILANGSTVADIRKSITLYQRAPDILGNAFGLGVSPVFFGGLAFALLLVAALAAFAGAGLDGVSARAAAVVAVLLSVGGLVLTALAVRYVDIDGAKLGTSPPSYLDFVTGSSFGVWAMVLGYLLIGVGAFLAAGSRDELRELLRDDFDDDIDDDINDDIPDEDKTTRTGPDDAANDDEVHGEPARVDESADAASEPVPSTKQRRSADEIW